MYDSINHHQPFPPEPPGCDTTPWRPPPCSLRILSSALSIALAGVLPAVAHAQSTNPLTTLDDPPALESQQESVPATGAVAAPATDGVTVYSTGAGGAQALTAGARIPGGRRPIYRLRVAYVDGEIWNPSTGRGDKVRLRSYQNARQRTGQDRRFVAPVMRVNQGTSLWIRLINDLPADDPSCPAQVADENVPHCFNTTNLHTHGVWANPNENPKLNPNDPNEPVTQGDNVYHKVAPGQRTLYRIDIPENHPGGTFWYHAHVHGSTALQVSSGMAGALIIRGAREPEETGNGDLDVLLRSTTSVPVRERIMLFQQIQYHCAAGADAPIRRNDDGSWHCDEADVGGIERYAEVFGTQQGRAFWRSSGRYTTINGAMMPDIGRGNASAVAGRLERWRLLHGGVRDTISLAVRRLVVPEGQASADVRNMSEAERQRFVDTHCTGERVPLHLVAADGLTMAAAQRTDNAVLQPGYRWDALMMFPAAGQYCVLDEAVPAAGSVNQEQPIQRLLGITHVSAGIDVPVAEIGNRLRDQLISLANTNIRKDSAARNAVVADLRDSLKLGRFVPHQTIADSDLNTTERQTVRFNLVPPTGADGQLLHHVDGKLFNKDDPARLLRLGDVQEWEVTSGLGAHPFHIHVNPFQIVRIEDASGRDVSAPGAEDGGDPQYPGMKGQWRDTIMVKSGYKAILRSRYERFVGDFVLHCHILDHEDQGMMERVRIHDPKQPETLSRPYPKHLHGSADHAEPGAGAHAH